MRLAMQAKMLRVLDQQEVVPMGDNFASPLEVRVLSATHRDLRSEVAAGRFHEDLHYRLGQVMCVSYAAQALGLSRAALQKKIKEYQLR